MRCDAEILRELAKSEPPLALLVVSGLGAHFFNLGVGHPFASFSLAFTRFRKGSIRLLIIMSRGEGDTCFSEL